MASNRELRVAVIGVGHLGRHHARILNELPDTKLVAVVDCRPRQAESVARKLGTVACTSVDQLPENLDAAVVAVPTTLHREIALQLIERDVSLLVEKPLAESIEAADQIVEQAERRGVLLQVGHVERFNPAFQALQLTSRWGRPFFIQCVREVPYSFRSTDIGVILDLMIHDIDLIMWITGEFPSVVRAHAWAHFGRHEDVAVAMFRFPGGTVAHCVASRVSPAVRRELKVSCRQRHLTLDLMRGTAQLMEPTERVDAELTLFTDPPAEKVPWLRNQLFERYFRRRELSWPSLLEPLRAELQHFLHCVRTGTRPSVDGLAGRNAVAVAHATLNAARDQLSIEPHPYPRAA